MKKIFLSIVVIAVSAIVSFAQNYPFPMNESGYSYPFGITATTPDNATIQSKFESWESSYYEESGDLARIKFNPTSQTVSEGIGYGMLIYVYMANSTNNTKCQNHFDKLYAYYLKFKDSNGLMHWKINGFSNVSESGAATDGDLDVALALCLAAKQWGSSSTWDYAKEARIICNKIYDKETATNDGLFVLKPGDMWNDKANPCYFTLASIKLFSQAQSDLKFESTRDWDKLYNGCVSFLKKSQKNGLWPDWSYWNGSVETNTYGWDACRTPWRVAWDYLWFGNTDSKAMLANTIAFMDTKGIIGTPANAEDYKNLSGSGYSSVQPGGNYGKSNSAFTGGFASALMSDNTQQTNLDKYYKQIKGRSELNYYAPTLQLLYLLTLSGNAANFFDVEGGAPVNPTVTTAETDGSKITLNCSKKMASSTSYSNFTIYKNGTAQSNVISSMSVSGSTITLNLKNIEISSSDIISISYNGTTLKSESGEALGAIVKMSVKNKVSGGSSIIADCEDVVTLTGGAWYTYNDSGDKGKSTVTPTAGEDFVMTAGGANGTAYAAKMTGTLNKGELTYDPFVGMGFNMMDDEKVAYDCTGATGIKFYHKGDAVVLSAKTTDVDDSDYYAYTIDQHSNWTLVDLSWDNFAQAGWGTAVNFNLANITGFQWQYQQKTGSCEVWIDEVTIEGITIEGGETDDDVDRSKLAATLSAANTLLSGATTSVYPQSAITTFTKAIEAAATVHDTPTSTQDEIDAANTTLTKAIATFKATGFDNSTLLATIATAEKLYNSATTTKYPQAAINALGSAISTAKTASTATSQTTLDNANTKLLAAIETFKASEISAGEKETLLTGAEEATTITGGAWYTYTDSNDGGKSTVTPTSGTDFVMTSGGANGTANAAKMTGTLNKGDLTYDPFVGMGFNMMDDEKVAYDCTGATGIKFYHKGDAVVLSAKTTDVDDSDYYAYTIDQHSNWTLVDLSWDNFAQAGWGTAVNFNLANITGFQWQYQQPSGSCEVWIDEVVMKGIEIESPDTPDVPVDKTELASLITLSTSILNTTTAGTAVGQYSAAKRTALTNALNTAKTVNSNASATQATVDAQVTALQNAYDAYVASKVTDPTIPVDKTELESLITLSNTILNTTTAGTAVGQYSAAKRTALTNALNTAKTVNSNASATQAAVDAQVTALQNAYDAYVASKIGEGPVNKDDLAYLIASSETALNTTTAGTAVGQYSSEKRAALINALNSAKPVYMDERATQGEVDAITKTLKTAYNDYMNSKNTGTAVDDIDFVLNVYPNPCVDFLTIESSEVIKTIKTVGINGSQSTYSVNQESVELDVTNMKNGTFVLFIEFADGSIKTTKVVKY